MKKQLIVFAAVLAFLNTTAQIRGGFENNSQWYIDDNKIKISPEQAEDRFRSNTYLKLDYDYKNWTFGTQLEGYLPKAIMNYSPDFKGVNFGTVHARYYNQDLGLDVTAGHFYDQFGSGLLFRAWEDRQLGLNNAILGLNAKYQFSPDIKATVMGGKQRIGMGFDLSSSWIMGVDTSVDLASLFSKDNYDLSIGASYIGRIEEETKINKGLDALTSAFSLCADYSIGGFYLGAEYVYKDKDALVEGFRIYPKVQQAGNALLINSGYSEKGLAFNLTLRRMENMSFFSQREFGGDNLYLTGTMNYIPALTKQYDYSLQNIYVYQAQPNFDLNFSRKLGEIGGQFDFYYDFKKESLLGGKYGTNLVINGSYWAGIKSEVNSTKTGVTSDFFGFGEKYYSDFGLEVRKKWSPNWSSIFMYLNQYYNSPAITNEPDKIKANILSAETTYQFLEQKSVRLELQHQWADGQKGNWIAGTVEHAINNRISVFASDMYNYGNDDKEQRIHYYNFGGSYTVGTTRLSASYGRQRGGLLCVGGVCRYVSEAAGLTFGITTSF